VATRRSAPAPLQDLLRSLGIRWLVGIAAPYCCSTGFIIDPYLRVAEDQSGERVFQFDDANQAAVLVHTRHVVKDMLRFGHVNVIAAQVQKAGLAQELARQADDLRGKSS
jgi:hypothetical protein